MNVIRSSNEGWKGISPRIDYPHSARRPDRQEPYSRGATADAVQLSADDDATAGSTPGIRFEKVARIRSDIRNGTYDVQGKLQVALDRLLDDLM